MGTKDLHKEHKKLNINIFFFVLCASLVFFVFEYIFETLFDSFQESVPSAFACVSVR